MSAKSTLPGRTAALTIALAMCMFLACSSPIRVTSSQSSSQGSTTQPTASGTTTTLRAERNRTFDEMTGLQVAIAEFHIQHPQIPLLSDAAAENLGVISRALVAAQLEMIDSEARYAPEHPTTRQARAKVQKLRELYESTLKQCMELNRLAAQYAKLTAELAQKQEFLRRLDERLRELSAAKG